MRWTRAICQLAEITLRWRGATANIEGPSQAIAVPSPANEHEAKWSVTRDAAAASPLAAKRPARGSVDASLRERRDHVAVKCATCGSEFFLPWTTVRQAYAAGSTRFPCDTCTTKRELPTVTAIAPPKPGAAKGQSELVAKTVSDGVEYVFAEATLDSAAFFTVRPGGARTTIALNREHPLMPLLGMLQRDNIADLGTIELRERLLAARKGMELVLRAWARYEDEQPSGPRKRAAEDARADWGREALRITEEGG